MPNQFNSVGTVNVSNTGLTTVYTAPANSQVTVLGASLSNKNAAPVTVNLTVTRQVSGSPVSYSLITGATVPVGGSLVPIGIDEKIVMKGGDLLQAQCTTPGIPGTNAIDAFVSVLEIT